MPLTRLLHGARAVQGHTHYMERRLAASSRVRVGGRFAKKGKDGKTQSQSSSSESDSLDAAVMEALSSPDEESFVDMVVKDDPVSDL